MTAVALSLTDTVLVIFGIFGVLLIVFGWVANDSELVDASHEDFLDADWRRTSGAVGRPLSPTRPERAAVSPPPAARFDDDLLAIKREVDPAVREAMAHARARREFLERHPELWR